MPILSPDRTPLLLTSFNLPPAERLNIDRVWGVLHPSFRHEQSLGRHFESAEFGSYLLPLGERSTIRGWDLPFSVRMILRQRLPEEYSGRSSRFAPGAGPDRSSPPAINQETLWRGLTPIHKLMSMGTRIWPGNRSESVPSVYNHPGQSSWKRHVIVVVGFIRNGVHSSR